MSDSQPLETAPFLWSPLPFQFSFDLREVNNDDNGLRLGTLELVRDTKIHGLIAGPNLFLIPELGHVILTAMTDDGESSPALKEVKSDDIDHMLGLRHVHLEGDDDVAYFPQTSLEALKFPLTVYVAFNSAEALRNFRQSYAMSWSNTEQTWPDYVKPHKSLDHTATFLVYSIDNWVTDADTEAVFTPAGFAARIALENHGYVGFDDMRGVKMQIKLGVVTTTPLASAVPPAPYDSPVLFDAIALPREEFRTRLLTSTRTEYKSVSPELLAPRLYNMAMEQRAGDEARKLGVLSRPPAHRRRYIRLRTDKHSAPAVAQLAYVVHLCRLGNQSFQEHWSVFLDFLHYHCNAVINVGDGASALVSSYAHPRRLRIAAVPRPGANPQEQRLRKSLTHNNGLTNVGLTCYMNAAASLLAAFDTGFLHDMQHIPDKCVDAELNSLLAQAALHIQHAIASPTTVTRPFNMRRLASIGCTVNEVGDAVETLTKLLTRAWIRDWEDVDCEPARLKLMTAATYKVTPQCFPASDKCTLLNEHLSSRHLCVSFNVPETGSVDVEQEVQRLMRTVLPLDDPSLVVISPGDPMEAIRRSGEKYDCSKCFGAKINVLTMTPSQMYAFISVNRYLDGRVVRKTPLHVQDQLRFTERGDLFTLLGSATYGKGHWTAVVRRPEGVFKIDDAKISKVEEKDLSNPRASLLLYAKSDFVQDKILKPAPGASGEGIIPAAGAPVSGSEAQVPEGASVLGGIFATGQDELDNELFNLDFLDFVGDGEGTGDLPV
jgi:hypothetical protein